MRRREFIAGVAGAVALPSWARAQQPTRVRRIAVLMGYNENDQEAQARVRAFKQQLEEIGWKEGTGFQIEDRWVSGNTHRMDAYAADFARMQPDLILSATTGVLRALLRHTRTVPIVFLSVSDPVGDRLVASL